MCSRSGRLVHCSTIENKDLGNILQSEELLILKYSLLVRLGIEQYAGACCKCHHALRHCRYLVLEMLDLKVQWRLFTVLLLDAWLDW